MEQSLFSCLAINPFHPTITLNLSIPKRQWEWSIAPFQSPTSYFQSPTSKPKNYRMICRSWRWEPENLGKCANVTFVVWRQRKITGFMFQYSLCPAKEYRRVRELLLLLEVWYLHRKKEGMQIRGIGWKCDMGWLQLLGFTCTGISEQSQNSHCIQQEKAPRGWKVQGWTNSVLGAQKINILW